MGKTRVILQRIRDTKGTFHAKMGSIKDRNGMDLTEAEDIKKRQQEYTEELYKKDLPNKDNHDGVITHLEPDILVCEVKWALESITMNKASGGDGIPVEQQLGPCKFPGCLRFIWNLSLTGTGSISHGAMNIQPGKETKAKRERTYKWIKYVGILLEFTKGQHSLCQTS